MARPTLWQTGTIVGLILDDQFNPYVGKVIITPSIPSLTVKTQAVVKLKPTEVTLDSAGAFSVAVGATDDPDTSRVGWTYSLTVASTTGTVDAAFPTWTFNVPQGTTVDLKTLTVDYPPSTGLPNVIGGGGGVSSWNDLQDKPAFIAAGADAAAARAAVGAGTSNLTIGSTASTAKAGDWKPDFTADVQGKPSVYPPSAHTHTASDVGASSFGASLIAAVNAAAGRTALGATSTGAALFTAADLAAAQNALGVQALIDAAVTAVRNVDLAATPIMSFDNGGTYSVTSSTRPILFCGQSTPPAMKATDRWISG